MGRLYGLRFLEKSQDSEHAHGHSIGCLFWVLFLGGCQRPRLCQGNSTPHLCHRGSRTFANCPRLVTLEIPPMATSFRIREDAFVHCMAMVNVSLPKSMAEGYREHGPDHSFDGGFGENGFHGCTWLQQAIRIRSCSFLIWRCESVRRLSNS